MVLKVNYVSKMIKLEGNVKYNYSFINDQYWINDMQKQVKHTSKTNRERDRETESTDSGLNANDREHWAEVEIIIAGMNLKRIFFPNLL